MQGQYHINVAFFSKDWFYTPQFLSGCFLFLLGLVINTYYDYVVTSLRKPGDVGHKIPHGMVTMVTTLLKCFSDLKRIYSSVLYF